jgi:hypothetical protein
LTAVAIPASSMPSWKATTFCATTEGDDP